MNDEVPFDKEKFFKNMKEEDLEVFKKYEKLEKIGEGAFGIVYKAKNRETQEIVAIKAIPLLKLDTLDVKTETEKEIKFMEIFNNNINSLKLHDKYEQNNTIFMVLDFCDGDISKYLEKSENGFSIYEIKVIFKQLNNILSEIRSKDMIHNDLKIENLLIKFKNNTKEFDVKLADYGIAKLISYTKDLTHNEWGLTPFTLEEKENTYIVEKMDLLILGIDIFRMLFKGICNDFEEYDKKISTIKDEELKDLLKRMIVEDAHKRIEWDEYFNHPFFKIDKIDFDKIKNIVKN